MNRFSKLILIMPILWALGCGEDPILEQARNLEKNESSKKEVKKEEKLPDISPPKRGDAAKEKKKMPSIAPPKVEPPKRVQEGEPPPKPEVQKFVNFEGTISVENWSGKSIRIDVFDGDQRNIGGKRPSVILSETVEKIGSFSIKIPQEDIMVWIGAYIDEDQDGRPGPTDPSGWYEGNPVSAKTAQKGISFSLGLPDEPSPK